MSYFRTHPLKLHEGLHIKSASLSFIPYLHALQVIDAAMESGADDVHPAKGEEDAIEGFKVLCAVMMPLSSDVCQFFGPSRLRSRIKRLILAVIYDGCWTMEDHSSGESIQSM